MAQTEYKPVSRGIRHDSGPMETSSTQRNLSVIIKVCDCRCEEKKANQGFSYYVEGLPL